MPDTNYPDDVERYGAYDACLIHGHRPEGGRCLDCGELVHPSPGEVYRDDAEEDDVPA